MRSGLDSSFFRPSRAAAERAKADGVGVWGGYLATRRNVGLASPWDLGSFDNVRVLDGKPIAYCSGWDDPVACRKLADAWGVRLDLDVEDGIRGDGPWVQPWIDAAGRDVCGLYGNGPVHAGRSAAFHVVAGYPGYDPQRTWGYVPRPQRPTGWQWRGSHDEYGGGVDRCWFDDWFATGAAPVQPEEEVMAYVIQGTDRPHVWITDGVMARRYIGLPEELERWLKTTKRPLERKPQYDVDRIPVCLRVPEDLGGTGMNSYDDVVYGLPQPQQQEVHAKVMAASIPADDAWAPTDEEVDAMHTKLGFYAVVGGEKA